MSKDTKAQEASVWSEDYAEEEEVKRNDYFEKDNNTLGEIDAKVRASQDAPLEESRLLTKSQSKVAVTMRWIAVLPAAVGAFVGVQLVIILADATMAEGHANWYVQLVNSFAGAYAFVFAGAHTAPRYQYSVGVILAVIIIIFMTCLLYLAYSIKTTDPWWWLALASAISIAAVVAAISQLKEDKWRLK